MNPGSLILVIVMRRVSIAASGTGDVTKTWAPAGRVNLAHSGCITQLAWQLVFVFLCFLQPLFFEEGKNARLTLGREIQWRFRNCCLKFTAMLLLNETEKMNSSTGTKAICYALYGRLPKEFPVMKKSNGNEIQQNSFVSVMLTFCPTFLYLF